MASPWPASSSRNSGVHERRAGLFQEPLESGAGAVLVARGRDARLVRRPVETDAEGRFKTRGLDIAHHLMAFDGEHHRGGLAILPKGRERPRRNPARSTHESAWPSAEAGDIKPEWSNRLSFDHQKDPEPPARFSAIGVVRVE